jgi:hypothetical protein
MTVMTRKKKKKKRKSIGPEIQCYPPSSSLEGRSHTHSNFALPAVIHRPFARIPAPRLAVTPFKTVRLALPIYDQPSLFLINLTPIEPKNPLRRTLDVTLDSAAEKDENQHTTFMLPSFCIQKKKTPVCSMFAYYQLLDSIILISLEKIHLAIPKKKYSMLLAPLFFRLLKCSFFLFGFL